jgi:hypothetical protein
MSWGTKEQKGEIVMLGLQAGLDFLSGMATESKKLNKEAKEDINSIDKNEIRRLVEINEEYTSRVNNLLYDTELGCRFKRTEEIFLMIVELIMLDLEYDYKETIQNFTDSFDNEEFIKAHDESLKKRKDRLKVEYEENLAQYNLDYKDYQEKKKNTGFFKAIFGDSPKEPKKPILRS